MKIEIKKKSKEYNKFVLKAEFTEGALLSLFYALETHSQNGSSIASDLISFLRPELEKVGIRP